MSACAHARLAADALPAKRTTVLFRAVQAHLETFLAGAEAAGTPVPAFVERELRDYLACRDLTKGFCRVRCACGHETLLGFPCRGRGFCPTCTGRRMNETAANLVDRVLARDVPYRQWVLSLPFGLRRLLANNGDLCTAVLGVFIRKVFAWLRRKARRLGVKDPAPGAVVAIQRANAAIQRESPADYRSLLLH